MKKLALSLLLCIGAITTQAQQDFVLKATEDNDFFAFNDQDRHYTQSERLDLLWPDNQTPWLAKPLNYLPTLGVDVSIQKYGFSVGQGIYTPSNIHTPIAQYGDQPYAGWLYLGMIRENRGVTFNQIPTLDYLEIDLGVVGPWALSGDAQNWVHGMIGIKKAEGWSHQLQNEPGLLVNLNRTCKVWELANNGWGIQLLPHGGVKLGNIQTSAQLGTELRAGYQIPDEFKNTPVKNGVFVFADAAGRAVLYNEFLNGNAFHSSMSVTPEPCVFELRGGIAFEFLNNELRLTYVSLGKEFTQQSGRDQYGSLAYTHRF